MQFTVDVLFSENAIELNRENVNIGLMINVEKTNIIFNKASFTENITISLMIQD